VSKTPEEELEDFLASQPTWLRTVLEGKYLFSSAQEQLEWIKNQDKVTELTPEYERILRQMPAQWNSYCKARNKDFNDSKRTEAELLRLPKPFVGRPREDILADEAAKLREAGLSYTQIALRLHLTDGGKPNGERVRGLLRSRKTKSPAAATPPDKTRH